jgi:hypothetical protein
LTYGAKILVQYYQTDSTGDVSYDNKRRDSKNTRSTFLLHGDAMTDITIQCRKFMARLAGKRACVRRPLGQTNRSEQEMARLTAKVVKWFNPKMFI